MPENNHLTPVELPMPIRFGEEGKTDVKILEEELKVTLIDGPDMEQLLSYIPPFVQATWAEEDTIGMNMTHKKRLESIVKMFIGKTLPGALETFRFTFLIEGMALQEVTHILRHRNATFSAVCTGDRFMYNDDVLIPESIANSPEFKERYIELAKKSKELYVDMVNSKQISLMDARYALHKSSEQKYFMSINFKDMLGFIRQRIDRAIQPKGSNLIAYDMWLEVCNRIPLMAYLDLVNLDQPSFFFIKTARSGHSTNLYLPEPHNDKFEYNKDDFIYNVTRPEINGTTSTYNFFEERLDNARQELKDLKQHFIDTTPISDLEIIDHVLKQK